MKKKDLIRAFIPGGVLTPRELGKIIGISRNLENEVIHFGSRQDIMFPGDEVDQKKLDKEFGSIQTNYEWSGQKYQNIVTSYVAVDIMSSRPWVTTGTYYNVLEYFDHRPRLKINITDPKQSLVPLFNGQLNFVASEHEDYWYLFIKFNMSGELQRWPVLIYSQDIGKIAAKIESYYLSKDPDNGFSAEVLFKKLNEELDTNNRTIDSELARPNDPFPYYEGFNKMDNNKYWLGLYWRNNRYTISFLEKVCELCDQTNCGRIIITPWKSFIVKGISEEDRPKWEFLCGNNGINLRHSSLELNWHLPVLDDVALKLKKYLVDVFDQHDISTYGLTFSIKEQPANLFTSIAILSQPSLKLFGKYNVIPRYNVFYSKNFDPNAEEYIPFAMYAKKKELPGILIKLSQIFYSEMNKEVEGRVWEQEVSEPQTQVVFQCTHCQTIYDERYGDPQADIPADMKFGMLPETYECPLCGAAKSAFEETEVE